MSTDVPGFLFLFKTVTLEARNAIHISMSDIR